MTAGGPVVTRSATPLQVTMPRWLLAATLVAVLVNVLWPSRPAGAEQSSLELWFADTHARGLPGWIGFGLVEFAANVLMFVPLGAIGHCADQADQLPPVVPGGQHQMGSGDRRSEPVRISGVRGPADCVVQSEQLGVVRTLVRHGGHRLAE
jgi:hypothetical protein